MRRHGFSSTERTANDESASRAAKPAGPLLVEAHHVAAGVDLPVLTEVPARDQPPPVQRHEGGAKRRGPGGVFNGKFAVQIPEGRGHEAHASPLALHDEPGGDRLHPAGGQGGHDLLPQDRADFVAVQPVEDAPGLLGVHEATVEVPGLPHRPLDGRPGDLVEDHAPHRDAGRQHLEQVPGDRLALAVLIGSEVQLAGVLDHGLELLDLVPFLPGDHVEGLEVVVDVDAEARPGLTLVGGWHVGGVARQVPDVSDRRLDEVVRPEEGRDGLGLGRGLDDN